ncbi:hypothetical protein MC885_015201 [Smutsia gigantea]|nr:hypothetical protein MC885_015201 [Smutsia gigantea]
MDIQEAAAARESRLGRMTQPGRVTGEVGADAVVVALWGVCSVRSVDGSPTTAFTVLECEGSRRLGSRPRRYLLTGQANGSLAMWDLTTAMDGLGQSPAGGLSEEELMRQLEQCELTPLASSRGSLPSPSPHTSLISLHSASSNTSLSGHRGSLSPPQAEARRRGGGSFVERCQELVRSGPEPRRPPTPAPRPSAALGAPLTPPKMKLRLRSDQDPRSAIETTLGDNGTDREGLGAGDSKFWEEGKPTPFPEVAVVSQRLLPSNEH